MYLLNHDLAMILWSKEKVLTDQRIFIALLRAGTLHAYIIVFWENQQSRHPIEYLLSL